MCCGCSREHEKSANDYLTFPAVRTIINILKNEKR